MVTCIRKYMCSLVNFVVMKTIYFHFKTAETTTHSDSYGDFT